jgi:hypothetical protein
MAELVGTSVCQNPGSVNVQSLGLFLDSIPKNVGDTSSHEGLAAMIHFGRRRRKNPEKELCALEHFWTPWIQGRIFIIQGTVCPFDLDAYLAKDQTDPIFSFSENLPWQVCVIVKENRDHNLSFRRIRGLPLMLRVLASGGGWCKNQTLQAQRQEKIQNATEVVLSAHDVFLLAA